MSIVHSVQVNTKLFTEEDLKISKMYINPDVYPGYYDNSKLPKEFQYKGRKIIDINEIRNLTEILNEIEEDQSDELGHGTTQHSLIRQFGRGGEANEVIASLNKFGFQLDSVPISVCILPNGKLYSLDGRTRLEWLESKGFKNVIVDYYICTSYAVFLTQAILRNPPHVSRSPMTTGDIINHCNGLIEYGWLKREYAAISAHVVEITGNRLKKETQDKIILNVLHGSGYTDRVKSLNEEKSKRWLKACGYHDNENNNGIYYKVVASTAWSKAISSSANTLIDDLLSEGKSVKELRVIVHTGTLEGADPAKSWKNKIDSFRREWKENLKNIENAFFNSKQRKSVIKLYGAIPAVLDLSHEYPMDKLVMFHVGDLKDKSFDEIDTVNSLEKALAA